VYCDIWYIFLIPQFLRHQTMDKVQKYNSFNAIHQHLCFTRSNHFYCLLIVMMAVPFV